MKSTQTLDEPKMKTKSSGGPLVETQRVALVFGGVSPEHEVSIQSAAQVAGGLSRLGERRGLAVRPIYISRDGTWYFTAPTPPQVPSENAIREAEQWVPRPEDYQAQALPFSRAFARLEKERIDKVLILIHGPGGEDGRIQAALDLAGIAYTGSGVPASALALDKPRCQAVLDGAGLPIAHSVTFDQHGPRAADLIAQVVGLPCVIKPARGGSSVGVTIVREQDCLLAAVEEALAVDIEGIAERFIAGREFTCGVLERDGGEIATPITEIVPPEGRYFDYEAKYEPGVSREITPAEIPASLASRLQSMALAAHAAIGCRGFSRVDFIADPSSPTILEINTIPGMTATSLLPQGAAAMGIDFPSLLELILDSARHD